ncbi:MAG: hypothetical protein KF723_01055 [Rhizobiaceae bacterium]|nr:hypothetical protein [Rhizobiaceae bacterium]
MMLSGRRKVKNNAATTEIAPWPPHSKGKLAGARKCDWWRPVRGRWTGAFTMLEIKGLCGYEPLKSPELDDLKGALNGPRYR